MNKDVGGGGGGGEKGVGYLLTYFLAVEIFKSGVGIFSGVVESFLVC